MKVAIVHEWLDTYAGSERVLEQLLLAWPEADLFVVCDFLPEEERGFLGGRSPHSRAAVWRSSPCRDRRRQRLEYRDIGAASSPG